MKPLRLSGFSAMIIKTLFRIRPFSGYLRSRFSFILEHLIEVYDTIFIE